MLIGNINIFFLFVCFSYPPRIQVRKMLGYFRTAGASNTGEPESSPPKPDLYGINVAKGLVETLCLDGKTRVHGKNALKAQLFRLGIRDAAMESVIKNFAVLPSVNRVTIDGKEMYVITANKMRLDATVKSQLKEKCDSEYILRKVVDDIESGVASEDIIYYFMPTRNTWKIFSESKKKGIMSMLLSMGFEVKVNSDSEPFIDFTEMIKEKKK